MSILPRLVVLGSLAGLVACGREADSAPVITVTGRDTALPGTTPDDGPPPPGSEFLWGRVAVAPDGRWMAVGRVRVPTETGAVAVSADGEHWEVRRLGPEDELGALTSAFGEWYATGRKDPDDPVGVWSSVDGSDWVERSRPTGASHDIGFDGTRLVIPSGTEGCATTPDGQTWTDCTLAKPMLDPRPAVGAAVGAGFVLGDVGQLHTSIDGVVWDVVPMPPPATVAEPSDITYVKDTWMVDVESRDSAGYLLGRYRLLSTDRTAWILHEVDRSVYEPVEFQGAACGISLGEVVCSQDLITWEQVPDSPRTIGRLGASDGRMVAATIDGIHTTTDGVTWNHVLSGEQL